MAEDIPPFVVGTGGRGALGEKPEGGLGQVDCRSCLEVIVGGDHTVGSSGEKSTCE